MSGLLTLRRDRRRAAKARGGKHVRRALLIAAAVVLEVAGTWLRGYGLGGNVAVQCRRGHLFTTIWIPAASVKAVRLGLWRIQRCPVGQHWSLVTPVKQSELNEEQKRIAREHTDIRIP